MEKKENKAAAILGNLDIVVASIILAILIVLTFLGVVWRYIFNAPFTGLRRFRPPVWSGSYLQAQAQHSAPATMLRSR